MTDSVYGFDSAFPVAASIVGDLVQRPEVSEHWAAASALPKMSVGALACHLGRQVVRAAERLPLRTGLAPLAGVDEHYLRAAWVHSGSPDDPANDRGTDNAEAELGPAALALRVAGATEAVRAALADGTAQEVVGIPWQGWALRRPDFLLTRMLEIVVHSDDLTAGLGLDLPEFPDAVFAPVRDLLVRLAVHRHGQSAVIGTLARGERTRQISAF